MSNKPTFRIELYNVEGKPWCLYFNDYRMAGPKPLGAIGLEKYWDIPVKDLLDWLEASGLAQIEQPQEHENLGQVKP